jgi:hypothetical protein
MSVIDFEATMVARPVWPSAAISFAGIAKAKRPHIDGSSRKLSNLAPSLRPEKRCRIQIPIAPMWL